MISARTIEVRGAEKKVVGDLEAVTAANNAMQPTAN